MRIMNSWYIQGTKALPPKHRALKCNTDTTNRCVFKESLRMFPQVGSIVKWTEEGAELAGRQLPPQVKS